MRSWAAAVVIGLVLASCTSDSNTEQADATPKPSPRRGGEVVFGVLGEPPTLDPYDRRATDLTWAAVRPLYPSLYRFRPGGTPEPYLAGTLEEDGDTVLVGLADMHWSNGAPITSADVVASIRRARPPSGFALVRSVRAIDDRTLVLRGNVDSWKHVLATIAFVLPGGRPQRAGEVFGGPLMLRRYRPGLELVYGRNREWTLGGGYINRLRVQFVSHLGFLIELVEDKRMDGALIPTSVNIDERLDENGIEYLKALGWERIYLDFQGSGLARGERAAFVNGVDRGAIAEAFVRDDGRISNTLHPAPGNGPIAEGVFERGPRRIIDPVGEVLVAAPAGDELLVYILRMMRQQLSGQVDLELAVAEVAAVYGGGEGDPGGVSIHRAAGIPGMEDPTGVLRTLDAWPLFHVDTVVAVGPHLGGVDVNPTIEGPLWNVEDWWLAR